MQDFTDAEFDNVETATVPASPDSVAAMDALTKPTTIIPINPTAPAATESLTKKLRAKRGKAATGSQANTSKTHQTSIPVQTPDKIWWYRSHPSSEQQVPVDMLILSTGPDEGKYFLSPDVDFPDELDQYISPVMLTRCINSDGTEFFYLAKQSAKSPASSTRRCINAARTQWVKQRWNPTSKGYDLQYARQLRRQPVWSDKTMDELLEMAFEDNYIERADHAVINRLLYPDDDDYTDTDDKTAIEEGQ
jgi:hypothetical protein